jgi:HD-GYP domain-containing protein (c-di-GMP phosphodiesterase class II)
MNQDDDGVSPESARTAAGTVEAVVVGARDVHEEALVGNALRTLAEGNTMLLRAGGEDGVLQRVCDAIVESGGYRMAWYGRPVNDAARSVAVVARSGGLLCDLDQVHITWGGTPAAREPTGEAIRTERIQGSRDVRHDPLAKPWREAATTCGLGSSLALPILVDGRFDGVLSVYGAAVGEFDGRAHGLLADLAKDIGCGLARLRDRARLFGALMNSVDLLAATVESRDPYTAGHQSNVSALSVRLGQVLGLDDDELLGLELGAKIHDLGKIATPVEILNKLAPLSPPERQEVARHAEAGWEIARKFEWPWPIAEIIHQHHERLDGSGYPRGLRGEQILREARIVAVADVYDALSHGRPQRSPHRKERSLEILLAEKGSRFEPEVIEALITVLDTSFTPPTARKA